MRHDAKALAKRGQTPGGYVRRAQHPMLEQMQQEQEEGRTKNDDKTDLVDEAPETGGEEPVAPETGGEESGAPAEESSPPPQPPVIAAEEPDEAAVELEDEAN